MMKKSEIKWLIYAKNLHFPRARALQIVSKYVFSGCFSLPKTIYYLWSDFAWGRSSVG